MPLSSPLACQASKDVGVFVFKRQVCSSSGSCTNFKISYCIDCSETSFSYDHAYISRPNPQKTQPVHQQLCQDRLQFRGRGQVNLLVQRRRHGTGEVCRQYDMMVSWSDIDTKLFQRFTGQEQAQIAALRYSALPSGD